MVTSTGNLSEHRLRRVLTANGWFSLISGSVTAVFAGRLADFMEVPGAVLIVVGLGVVGFGILTLRNARRQPLDRSQALMTTIGDASWVVAATVVLAFFADSMSSQGRVLFAAVSASVAFFGLAQFIALRRMAASAS